MPDETTPDVLDELAADEAGDSNIPAEVGDTQDHADVSGETPAPEDDVQSRYEELSRRVGQQGNELGELRREREALRAQLDSYQRTYQPPPQEQQQVQQGYVNPLDHLNDGDREYLDNLLMNDPIQGHRVIAQLEAQAAVAAARSEWEQQFAPVQDSVQRQQAGRIVQQLQGEYGDDFIRAHAQELDGMIRADAAYFSDEGTQGQRIRMALDAIRWREAQNPPPATNGQPRNAQGQYAAHVEGGSNGHTSAPSTTRETLDPELAAMRDFAPPPDAFGARVALPGV